MLKLDLDVKIETGDLPEDQDMVFKIVDKKNIIVIINKHRLFNVLSMKNELTAICNGKLQEWIQKHLDTMAERENQRIEDK